MIKKFEEFPISSIEFKIDFAEFVDDMGGSGAAADNLGISVSFVNQVKNGLAPGSKILKAMGYEEDKVITRRYRKVQ